MRGYTYYCGQWHDIKSGVCSKCTPFLRINLLCNIFVPTGDALEIEMELYLASFDSISEVNMVSRTLQFPT